MINEALEAYFTEAASWDIDRSAQTVRGFRMAWVMAITGWSCAVAGSIALMLLMPLKTVEPYVIRVDNTTGIVDIVPMYAGHADMSETVSRYLLTHYITVCESFNFVSAEHDYQECGAFHTIHRNEEWAAFWSPSNPKSPLNLYKDGTTVHAQVTAVTFFRQRAAGINTLAQVRYIKAKRLPGGTEVLSHWIATLEYAYVTPSHDPKTRQFNPLGFRVVDCRTEPESAAGDTTFAAPIEAR